MYKAIVVDLDGTVFTSDHKITEETISYFRYLKDEKKIPIFIATGRAYIGANMARELFSLDTPMVTGNGTTVYGLNREEVLEKKKLNEKVVRDLVTLPNLDLVSLSVFQNGTWMAKNPRQDWGGRYRYEELEIDKLAFDEIEKVSYTSNHQEGIEELNRLKSHIMAHYEKEVSGMFTTSEVFELIPRNVSKWTGVLPILQSYGIDPSETIAFGDGENDFELLNNVGKGVLMGNSTAQLAERLPHNEKTLTNDENGVVHYLKKIFG